MAKKDLIPVETLTSSINIDKNDVLAVFVSRAEAHIQAQFTTAKKEIKRLEAQVKTTEVDLKKALEALSTASVAAIVSKLKEVAALSKNNLVINTSWGYGSNGGGTILTAVTLQNSNNTYHTVTVDTVITKYNKEATDLDQLLKETTAALAAARATAVDWQKRLAQIPTLERKYRANLAEATLKKTEQGQALLDTLSTDFEQDVLLLPGA